MEFSGLFPCSVVKLLLCNLLLFPPFLSSKKVAFSFQTPFSGVVPLLAAARSKAKVYGRSPAEIVGSNPARGMDVCLLVMFIEVSATS